MEDKVFFDTNIITSEKGLKNFLGGREQLSRFQRVAEVMIPKIVFDELIFQKRKTFREKRDTFKTSPFFEIYGLSHEKITDDYIDIHLEKMRVSENIRFTVIPLQDEDILNDIRELAIAHQAPFEANTDGGFKDAIIYFTVIQYTVSHPDDKISFISKDQRLCEAFKKHPNIKVFKEYDEYEKYQQNYFVTDYFIDRLRTDLGDETITPESIVNTELGSDLIWRLKIETSLWVFDLEVDYASREILHVKATPKE